MPLKFCANLSFMFNESDSLIERYDVASRSGFKAVECAFPYNIPITELVKAKTSANVDQILINSFPGNLEKGDLGLAAISGREEEFKKSLDKSIEYAEALGCNKIHIMAGKSLSGGIIDTGMEGIYKDNLQYAVQILEQKNITGLIEPISQSAVPDYYMNSFSKGLKIVKEINSKFLKLQLDIFHLQITEGNLTNRIKELLPYTGHIQISQAPNRYEPSAPGEINYQYILNLLEELDYAGYIGLEYKPRVDTGSSFDWIKEWGYEL